MPLRVPAASLLLLLAAAPALGSGYAINDQGSRAMAQGLAAVATLEGPENVFFNPAAIAEAPSGMAAGVALLAPDLSSRPATAGGREFESSRDQFAVPHLHVVQAVAPKWRIGVGVNAPFGLGTEWPKDFPGRFISRSAELKTVQLSVVAARRLANGWSVGFGPTVTHGEVELVRDVDLTIFQRGHEGEAQLTGDGKTLGWRAGARWRGEEGWRFGVAAHGQSELHFRGRVDYTVPPVGAFSLDETLRTLFVDGDASTTLTLPASASAGFGRVRERWTWEVDLSWTNWSVMDEVVVDLQEVILDGQPFVLQEFFTNDWHDSWALRAGLRRRVGERWSWAAGAYADQSPVPVRTADPLLPDSDRLSATAGATYSRGAFALDFAAQAIRFERLETQSSGNPFPARWDSSVVAFSVTAGWTWGRTSN